eukprot:scaffold94175_cov17-Prasinocladus_malaysianus.AAC.1
MEPVGRRADHGGSASAGRFTIGVPVFSRHCKAYCESGSGVRGRGSERAADLRPGGVSDHSTDWLNSASVALWDVCGNSHVGLLPQSAAMVGQWSLSSSARDSSISFQGAVVTGSA